MSTTCDLAERKCLPCEGKSGSLEESAIATHLVALPDWQRSAAHIERTFKFGDHYRLMAFVNAVAWISHREDHHPEMLVGYNTCRVRYWTHTVSGLTDNDFICAAKVDRLIAV